MKVGDRVLVVAAWSSFRGMRGVVAQTRPHLMIVLDDDPRPMRVGDREVVAIEPANHVAGAE